MACQPVKPGSEKYTSMEASASSSSFRKAVIAVNPPSPDRTTEQSANEGGPFSAIDAKDLSEAANRNTTTNESLASGNSHNFSPGNIVPQLVDNARGHEPEIINSSHPVAQSQVHNTSENVIVDNAAPLGATVSPKNDECSRPKTSQMNTLNGFDVGKLASLMEEQISLLRRIDERQAAGDLSQQPMPGVSATSNSTWGTLLRTTVAETIQPKVDRWRSGLDALLVFLGLFSAIVTAFLVESLNGLRPDDAARTNELLVNLTDILITLSGVNPINLNLSTPAQFQPDSTDIRLISYWSLSLILSLSVAALAVTCRGFLNMVTLSRHAKATDKLIDIKMRWKEADKKLGPVIEMMPQLLVIPVLLFVVGLVDNIFSDILQLAVLPTPVMATTGLAFCFIAAVIVFLSYSLFDGSVRPHSSPFQSTLAAIVSGRIIPLVRSWISWLRVHIRGLSTLHLPLHASHADSTSSGELHQIIKTEHELVAKHYHETVQAIHDNDTLDTASAALRSVLDRQRYGSFVSLEDEVATIVHLLSPEASIRANRTAAAAIAGIYVHGTNLILENVIIALVHAARRSVGSASLATLESSSFLEAMVALFVGIEDPGPEHPPLIRILSSEYASLNHQTDSRPEVIALSCGILFDSFLGPPHSEHQMTTAVALFRPAAIKTINVLQALCGTGVPYNHRILVIAVLMKAKGAQSVIQAAFEVLELLRDNSAQGLVMVSEIASAGLTRNDFSDHEHLHDLCVACILNIIQDASFHIPVLFTGGYWAVKVLVEIPFMEADSPDRIDDFRTAIEYSIETQVFSQPLPTPRRVMGQNMPISELTQILHRMSEGGLPYYFDLEAAIHDIRASRNS